MIQSSPVQPVQEEPQQDFQPQQPVIQSAPRGGGAPRGGARGGAPRGGGSQMVIPQQGQGAPRGGRGGAPRGGRGGAPPPQPVQTPQAPQARALYDYDAQTADELSFKEGNTLTVITKDSGGWWECELNGKRGWAPANYLQS